MPAPKTEVAQLLKDTTRIDDPVLAVEVDIVSCLPSCLTYQMFPLAVTVSKKIIFLIFYLEPGEV